MRLDLVRMSSLAFVVANGAELPKEPLLTKVMHDWEFDVKNFLSKVEEFKEEHRAAKEMNEKLERLRMRLAKMNVCHNNEWIVGGKSDY